MKTIIIGFDAFDPVIFEKLHSEGKTPHLSNLVDKGGYSRFSVSDPPQSEVSWTSIATGMNPGEHGIFDFVHRNPANYSRQVSLLPTKKGMLGLQFMPPHRAPTIFEAAVDGGYPGISLWWPATFPARLESPVWSIPGLGTPDIFGRLGVGIFYSMDQQGRGDQKTKIQQLTRIRAGLYKGIIQGPIGMGLTGTKQTNLEYQINIIDDLNAQLTIDTKTYHLALGELSPFIELSFRVGFGISIKAVTRVIMNKLGPEPSLYFLPLQIHPLRSPWPYGTPKRFVKDLWGNLGPYLTLGWPQDTTGLEENFLTDEQFLAICDQICAHREKVLLRSLDHYREGLVACVFDSLDRIQHMFLRDRKDVVEDWYLKLDALFGRIIKHVQNRSDSKEIRILVVSDHGFGDFEYKVNLNRWLLNRGYLSADSTRTENNLNAVNWSQSQAYAIGLNSIYFNILNRESQGIIPHEKKDQYVQSVKADLLAWKGPDGRTVIKKVSGQGEVFEGPFSPYGPDLLVGYRPGYRASALTGLGDWNEFEIEKNQDHWGADHCFEADSVPGVIFSNQGFEPISNLSYKEFPVLAIGKEIKPRKDVEIPTYSDEDQEKIEERLKDLGYL